MTLLFVQKQKDYCEISINRKFGCPHLDEKPIKEIHKSSTIEKRISKDRMQSSKHSPNLLNCHGNCNFKM